MNKNKKRQLDKFPEKRFEIIWGKFKLYITKILTIMAKFV